MTIRPSPAADAAGCDAAVTALPQFFGLESGVEAVRMQSSWVATDGAGAVEGFLTLTGLKAVAPARRRPGIGALVLRAAAASTADAGARHFHRPAGWEQSALLLVRPLG